MNPQAVQVSLILLKVTVPYCKWASGILGKGAWMSHVGQVSPEVPVQVADEACPVEDTPHTSFTWRPFPHLYLGAGAMHHGLSVQ